MTIKIQAITKMGCCIYTEIPVNEDFTMNDLIRVIKARGYTHFRRCDTMNRFVDVRNL